MTAFNIVKMKVKPEFQTEFEKMQLDIAERTAPTGLRSMHVVKIGEGHYCFLGEWDRFDDLVAARPEMIADLDRFRHMLADQGDGMGPTDPASGAAIVSWRAPRYEVMHG
jgi:hypothetical protein